MVFDVMSMGKPPEDVTMEHPMVQTISKMYEQAVAGAAEVMGVSFDRIEPSLELAVLDHDLPVAAGMISKGTVAGQRLSWTGYCDGKPLIVDEQIWYATRDIPAGTSTCWRGIAGTFGSLPSPAFLRSNSTSTSGCRSTTSPTWRQCAQRTCLSR